MDAFYLIYDQDLEKEELDSFFEKLDPAPKEKVRIVDFSWDKYSERDLLLFWVSDKQGRELLIQAPEKSAKIVFLPHPELKSLAKSFGVKGSKKEVFEQLEENERIQPLDLLMVNEVPCFNSLVIGDRLGILYDRVEEGFFKTFKTRFFRFLELFRKVKLQSYTVKYKVGEEEKSLEIAAMGLLAVAHNESNIVFKRLIQNSGLNDGLIHLIIFAPKSLFSLISFGLQNLFFPVKGGRIPDFVAYLSTSEVEIIGEEEMQLGLDGQESKEKSVSLSLSEKKLPVFTGFEDTKESEKQQKEVNLGRLPTGRLKEELTKRYLPWARHATTEEFKELFSMIRENSQTTTNYMVLMALSTLIATFGLFGDSGPVVIGAMILAPLMGPIISLAMGALRQDEVLIKGSLITIFWGVCLGLFFAVLITWITPLKTPTSEILARIRPNLLDLGIAVASGIAGAFAYSREEIAKTLAGVAISVALVPPLAVTGIGLGWGDWNIFWGAALLLGTNLAGIVMAAAMTFLVLGFSPFQIAKKGLLISLAIFLLVAAPLIWSFSKMVQENKIIQSLSGKDIPHGLLRDVRVLNLSPLRLSLTILSDRELHEQDFLQIQKEIQEKLNEPVQLELRLGVEVVTLTNDSDSP
ncbi:TIGR00341 family protein [Algoriphagus mannitolivorans]|uniref:TIGR00341 family protein n=1 Tax=Algoriphagus mannitolivorans TaxID=226504 RepID=UPI000425E3E5|nr:TIGR00341 family protein [Algoriphagus mannitolivorans]